PGSPRYRRESITLQRMLEIHCGDHHVRAAEARLCVPCQTLLDYAAARLRHCPWGDTKAQCTRCTIHCYRALEREQAREAMRYAGPRMAWRHPILAVRHALDRFRSPRRQAPRRRPPQRHDDC
ncbi:MAG TPA: nitrous oxide-stimulated promoter family protein, partial [Myxococcales bacterium]|nr:nitrous oxide-stimulated promoter family protein [Myxococcales bacterium]